MNVRIDNNFALLYWMCSAPEDPIVMLFPNVPSYRCEEYVWCCLVLSKTTQVLPNTRHIGFRRDPISKCRPNTPCKIARQRDVLNGLLIVSTKCAYRKFSVLTAHIDYSFFYHWQTCNNFFFLGSQVVIK